MTTELSFCFEAWRPEVSSTFVPLEATAHGNEVAFRGGLAAQDLGDVAMAHVAGSAVTVRRTPHMIRREDRGLLKFGMQVRGYCVLTQDNREAALTPGDLALYDTTRPYALEFERDFQMLVVMVPRERLGLRPAELADLTARRVSGRRGMGAVMSAFLASLATRAALDDLSSSLQLSDAVLDLMAATCVENLASTDRSPLAYQEALLMRIEAYMEERLSDPSLASSSVAAAHHISVRYLQKMFEAKHTTVADWIRERRIEHCRHDLLDRRLAHLSVSAVGARWGFLDAAHFSRVFKAHVGQPPSAVRAAVLASMRESVR